MKFSDTIRMCLRNLTKHKMRTVLTVMGVVIGTCAVIVMISLGVGMNEMQTQMLSEWADLTLIEVYNYSNGEQTVELNDATLAQFKTLGHVKAATPFYTNMYSGQQIAIYSGDYMLNCPLVGVYMNELEQFGYTLSEGRFADSKDPKGTVLVGSSTGGNAFDYINEEYLYSEQDENGIPNKYYVDPFKDGLRIVPVSMDMDTWTIDYSILDESSPDNQEYGLDLNVVGRIKGNWQDYNTMEGIYIDISYMKELIDAYNELNPDNQYDQFKGVYQNARVRVDDMNNVAEVESALQDMGFQTYSANELRENMAQQTRTIQLMLGALAAISLFVAALNITNTMIMSIIERTREIGIMKVLGCDLSKIRLQFLGEAASIGFIGGVAGIVLSYLVSFAVNTFLAEFMMGVMGGGYYGETAARISIIPPWLALAALAFATVVGLVSGFYPANKGVKISALAAISHD